MPVTIEPAGDSTYLVRATGLMTRPEFEAAQAVAAGEIGRSGAMKVLFVLDEFEGWSRDDGWGDMGFYVAHGRDVERIALVGEDRWRDAALMFAGAGLRRAPVKYFGPGEVDRARAWLSSE